MAEETSTGESSSESRCRLLVLSHDELGMIIDGLTDPLDPVVAVAIGSTCKGLRTPLRAMLAMLEQQHTAVKVLCYKLGRQTMSDSATKWSCAELRKVHPVLMFDNWDGRHKDFTADDMAALAMVLQRQPRLTRLQVCGAGNTSMQALCESLGSSRLPFLRRLGLRPSRDKITLGPPGAEALAASLRRGVLPKLEHLDLSRNPIGSEGVAALAGPLRKLPGLKHLDLNSTLLGNHGMASLFADISKDDLKALENLVLDAQGKVSNNSIGEAGIATLVAAIDGDAMPRLESVEIGIGGHRERVRHALGEAKRRRAVA